MRRTTSSAGSSASARAKDNFETRIVLLEEAGEIVFQAGLHATQRASTGDGGRDSLHRSATRRWSRRNRALAITTNSRYPVLVTNPAARDQQQQSPKHHSHLPKGAADTPGRSYNTIAAVGTVDATAQQAQVPFAFVTRSGNSLPVLEHNPVAILVLTL